MHLKYIGCICKVGLSTKHVLVKQSSLLAFVSRSNNSFNNKNIYQTTICLQIVWTKGKMPPPNPSAQKTEFDVGWPTVVNMPLNKMTFFLSFISSFFSFLHFFLPSFFSFLHFFLPSFFSFLHFFLPSFFSFFLIIFLFLFSLTCRVAFLLFPDNQNGMVYQLSKIMTGFDIQMLMFMPSYREKNGCLIFYYI